MFTAQLGILGKGLTPTLGPHYAWVDVFGPTYWSSDGGFVWDASTTSWTNSNYHMGNYTTARDMLALTQTAECMALFSPEASRLSFDLKILDPYSSVIDDPSIFWELDQPESVTFGSTLGLMHEPIKGAPTSDGYTSWEAELTGVESELPYGQGLLFFTGNGGTVSLRNLRVYTRLP